MTGFPTRTLVVCAYLLPLVTTIPAHADPVFVKVYGRTYKVDPPYPPAEPKGPKVQEIKVQEIKLQEIMKALPSDIAGGPGFRPSHEQVLAEVEERTWIARNQLADKTQENAVARNGWTSGGDGKAAEQEVTGSLPAGIGPPRSPELQTLYDRYRALNLLSGEVRRSMGLPVRSPEAGFSRPKLPPEVEAGYESLKFDPLEAYYGFRRVKAAFRSGDVALLSRYVHYPLTVTGKARRIIRSREQLVAAKAAVMDPRIREIVAKSAFETAFVRDKGMMLGEGEVWITPGKTGFGLGAINLE